MINSVIYIYRPKLIRYSSQQIMSRRVYESCDFHILPRSERVNIVQRQN